MDDYKLSQISKKRSIKDDNKMNLPHIDLANPDSYNDGVPHAWLKELREKAPVYWHEDKVNGVGFWVITKYKDLEFISKRPMQFSSEEKTALFQEHSDEDLEGMRLMMLNQDPPKHRQFRQIVLHAFTNNVMEELKDDIEKRCKEIVDKVAKKGECEFVQDLASQLPLQVICDMMGVDSKDEMRIFTLSNTMIGGEDPELRTSDEEAAAAASEIYMMGMELAEKYRNEPPETNITCRLLNAKVDGEGLTEQEFCCFFLMLLVAGNETTRTVTTNGMRLLIEHPEQLQMLVDDPSLIPGAVEECLRYAPAIIQFRRTAMEDIELGGQQIKKGDKVMLFYPSANRDEELFEDSDRFDILRKNNQHRAFGIGEHFCLGAHLARLELYAIFDEIITRLKKPKLVGEARRMRSNWVNGIKEMNIEFEPEL